MAVVADLVDVASAHALLSGDQSLVGWRRGSEEIGLELNHARAVEEQAFVQTSSDVDGDQRPRIMDSVPLALKKAEVFLSQLANGHLAILAGLEEGLRGRGRGERGSSKQVWSYCGALLGMDWARDFRV